MTNKGKVSILKILCSTLAIGLFCLGLSCLIPQKVNHLSIPNTLADDNAQSGILTSNYLSAPELIEANPATGELFVYDSYTQKLMSFNPTTQELTATSSWSSKVLSLCHTDTYLLALIEESENKNSLYIIDEITLEKTKLSSPIYDQIKILCFTACGDKVYLYSSDELLETAIIDSTQSTLGSRTLLASSSQFGADIPNHLMLSNETLYYTTENNGVYSICKLNDDGDGHIEKETIYTSESAEGAYVYSTPHNESANCILTANNYLLTINSNGNVTQERLPSANANSRLSSLTFIGSTKYFTDESSQTIWKLGATDSKLIAILKNASPTPAIINAKNHKYLEVTKTTGLYATPYATSPIKELSVGEKLTVIANDDQTYAGFYYCIYTNKSENVYGYIKKDDSFIELTKTEVYIPLKVIGDNKNYVYYLPTGISDTFNTGFKDLPSLSITTQVMAQKVTNSAGDDFYLIELENGINGYIRYSQVTTNFASLQTERIKCNGKTKRETTLYLSPSSSNETTYSNEEIENFNNLIKVKTNTRILLNEKVKAGNKYTKVTYQTETGETYIGYISTADLDADGLTPLQTVGVVLVIVNILILVLILLIRKRVIASRDNAIQTVD